MPADEPTNDTPGDAPDAAPIVRTVPHPLSAVPEAPHVEPLRNLEEIRAVFWQNVVREMLTAMPALAAAHPDAMDGRIAILTHAGERIPIAGVEPLFPCSFLAPDARQLCMAIQGTVFNVRTPNGEIFTIPLKEIRAIHTLSDELLHELEKLGRQFAEDGDSAEEPFGFAAFRSMRKQQMSPPLNNSTDAES